MTHSHCGACSVASLVVVALGLACDSATPMLPQTGSISVSSRTTGIDPDDEYAVTIDGGMVSAIGANGSIVFSEIVAGTHIVELVDVAANCTTAHTRKRVSVIPAQLIVAEFTVTCIARTPEPVPSFGTLRITTATNGVDRDTDGYTALITNLGSANNVVLPVNGAVEVNLVAGTRYFIALSGIAANCRIETSVSPDQVVDIVANAIASAAFSIGCEPVYPARLPPGSQLAFVRDGGIHVVNSDGTGLVRLTDGPSDCEPSWSPDGRRLSFVRSCNGSGEIYVMNADGTNRIRRAAGYSPSWSPDGKRIVFSALSQGSLNVFVMPADTDGQAAVELVNRPGWDGHPSWSPDGRRIAFVSDWVAYDFTYDIFVAPVVGGPSAQLTNGFNFWPNLVQYFQPAWSPDGGRLAVVRCPASFYTCDVGEIVIMTSDGLGVKPVVSTRGYARPTWSPDGSIIAFSSGGTVGWVRPASSERGFIVADGHSPAWRPMNPP